MDAPQRITDLRAVADTLADERSGGWLANSIAAGIAQALEAQHKPTVAEQISDLLISGLTGRLLLAELRRRFSQASRGDVFLGIAMAASWTEAWITLAEVERDIAQAETVAAA